MIKSGQVYYFHKDHLDSSSLITDATGAKFQEEDYLPFGGQRGSNSITASNYGFTDQEKDPEIGLYNYNARLYDPSIAVFVTADSIIPDPGGSQGFNRYTYCVNSPLNYTDPSGHWFEGVSFNFSWEGFVIVGISAAVDWLFNDVFEQDMNVQSGGDIASGEFDVDFGGGGASDPSGFGEYYTFEDWQHQDNMDDARQKSAGPITSISKSGEAELDKFRESIAPRNNKWIRAIESFLPMLITRGAGFGRLGRAASKSTFFKGRQSLGAAASDVRTGLKGLLKDAGLPTRGKIRFVPEKNALNTGIRVQDGGFVDRFGNVWRRPRGQIVGEPHWDVQLSRTGRQDLGWASRSGNHVNVSLDGRIVH
jgi:RHS repeat-associated protein